MYNKYYKQLQEETLEFDWSNYTSESVKRQLKKLALSGISALDEEDSAQFAKISSEMESIYSKATVEIDGESGLTLEPGIHHAILFW